MVAVLTLKIIDPLLPSYFIFSVVQEKYILNRSRFHYGIVHDIESIYKCFQALLCICLIFISKMIQYVFLLSFQNYSPRLKENYF